MSGTDSAQAAATTPEEVKIEAKAEDAKAEEVKAEEVKGDDAKGDDAKGDDAKADDAKSDDAKGDDAKSDDAKSDDAKSDDGKSDDESEAAAMDCVVVEVAQGGVKLNVLVNLSSPSLAFSMEQLSDLCAAMKVLRSGSA